MSNDVPHNHSKIWGFIRSLGMEHQAAEATLGSSLSGLQGQQLGVFSRGSARINNVRWSNSETGWFKANVDGAVDANYMASCGGVIRDSNGSWVRGFSRNLGALSC